MLESAQFLTMPNPFITRQKPGVRGSAGSGRVVGHPSTNPADAKIESGNGSVARDTGAIR
jgi:hypothetical protein